MPTKKSMLQAQFVPFSPLPLPEFRDLPLVFWMIAAISLLPALPVQSSSQISHFYRGLSSNPFVTVILPRWTHFDNHPLPIRESPTKGPAVTNMAFRNPPPATSTISYSPSFAHFPAARFCIIPSSSSQYSYYIISGSSIINVFIYINVTFTWTIWDYGQHSPNPETSLG